MSKFTVQIEGYIIRCHEIDARPGMWYCEILKDGEVLDWVDMDFSRVHEVLVSDILEEVIVEFGVYLNNILDILPED